MGMKGEESSGVDFDLHMASIAVWSWLWDEGIFSLYYDDDNDDYE